MQSQSDGLLAICAAEPARDAERQKTDAALHQERRLLAVGQLAGGVAHDFNNMLATIMGCLELMERRLDQGREADDTRLRRLIERATDAVQRGAQLTSRLLACSPSPVSSGSRCARPISTAWSPIW
jgi:signal transduction histidine kinase